MAKIVTLSEPEPRPATRLIAAFQDIPDLGDAEHFPAGMTLFRQGHRPSALRFIVSGLVKTVRLEEATEALVSLREPGWVLGLAPAYLAKPYLTSGITATPCVLRSLAPAAFRAHLEDSPRLAAWVLELFLAQARRDELERAEMALYAAPDRLARTLVRLIHMMDAPRRQGQIELALPITYAELAQLVGVSHQHLSRLLATFEAAGKLCRRKGVLLLPLTRWP
jgi:CRP-like cAMP-binding protein